MIVPTVKIVLPGGSVKYQCTRCWGVYHTKQQAETIAPRGSDKDGHRCRSHPLTVSNRRAKTIPSGHIYSIDGSVKCWCGDYHVEVEAK